LAFPGSSVKIKEILDQQEREEITPEDTKIVKE